MVTFTGTLMIKETLFITWKPDDKGSLFIRWNSDDLSNPVYSLGP